MLQCNNTIFLRGSVYVGIYKKGHLVDEWQDANLVVNGAREQLACLIASATENKYINRVAFGTNGSESDVSNTFITDQFVIPISSYSFPSNGQVRFNWLLKEKDNNGMAILEMGLLMADNKLFARKVWQNPFNKDSTISLEGHWIISF
jgi:hypothetical protein